MKYTPIIGLEVHIELETKSKMFCACSASHFGKNPNTQVCPVCLGLPGALPVANKKAIEMAVLLGLALGCEIPRFSKFDRKNYFYPDLPKGYQISQYDMPLARSGKWKGRSGKWTRIRRVHLEEDTGKLIHEAGFTLIDFNRSGVPLLEIVTEPDISSSLEAREFLEKLQQIVRYLGISRADMEKGQMRCEPTVNLEIEKDGKTFYTPLVEIKNINSFRFAQKAIEFEIIRQLREFQEKGIEKKAGNKTTRGFDERRGETVLQRKKEEAADYRYFPEPDIPPIRWTDEELRRLKRLLPELPEEKIARFMEVYGLSRDKSVLLAETQEKADFFEKVVFLAGKKVNAGKIANLIVNKKVDITRISAEDLARGILSEREMPFVSREEIDRAVEAVLENHQKAAEEYKKGKTPVLEFLIGQVMKVSRNVDPQICRKLLIEKIR